MSNTRFVNDQAYFMSYNIESNTIKVYVYLTSGMVKYPYIILHEKQWMNSLYDNGAPFIDRGYLNQYWVGMIK